jgi:nicotinamidase-related amidase
VVEASLASGGDGARITAMLAPDDEDYFVLKPKHSAFFGTPLELLLQHLRAHRLVLTGVASDQCVIATAMDARMRDLQVVVPGDCVASQSAARNRRALEHFRAALVVPTTASSRILLPLTVGAVGHGQ